MTYISKTKTGWLVERNNKTLFVAPTLAALEVWLLQANVRRVCLF